MIENVYTTGDLSRLLGVQLHRLTYALASIRIEPVRRVGQYRLFAESQLPAIRSALGITDQKKEGVKHE